MSTSHLLVTTSVGHLDVLFVTTSDVSSSAVSSKVSSAHSVTLLTAVGSIVGVSQNLVLGLLGLVVDVLGDDVCVVVVLNVEGHLDEDLLVDTSMTTSAAKDGGHCEQQSTDLEGDHMCEYWEESLGVCYLTKRRRAIADEDVVCRLLGRIILVEMLR